MNPPFLSLPTDYIIEYTDAEDFREPTTVWERMTVPGTQLSAVIKDLRSDQEYHARITAQFGSSDMGPQMTSPSTFTTPVIPPSRRFAVCLDLISIIYDSPIITIPGFTTITFTLCFLFSFYHILFHSLRTLFHFQRF